ncbi:uncharacterized protein LOC144097471 [Amblyomma americanum]
MSGEHFFLSHQHDRRRRLRRQQLPSVGICDIFILFAPQDESSGGFPESGYEYFKDLGKSTPFLFQLDDGPKTPSRITWPSFINDAKTLYRTMTCRGFGVTSRTYVTAVDADRLKNIFTTLPQILETESNYPKDEIITYFESRPSSWKHFGQDSYDLYRELTKMVTFITLITSVAERGRYEKECHVEPISSWDDSCLLDDYQTSLVRMLKFIKNMTNPAAKYFLVLDLGVRYFMRVDPPPLLDVDLLSPAKKPCSDSDRFDYPFNCTTFYPGGNPSLQLFYDHQCASNFFYDTALRVVYSFETDLSIQSKMQKVNEYMQKHPGYTVGWCLDGISENIAPSECGGNMNRLKAARDFLDQK